jgi:hypothetical protein
MKNCIGGAMKPVYKSLQLVTVDQSLQVDLKLSLEFKIAVLTGLTNAKPKIKPQSKWFKRTDGFMHFFR